MGAETLAPAITDRLRRCFEQDRIGDLAQLYHPDATFELHVGPDHDQRRGVAAIIERYAADYGAGVTFLRWDARPTGWGAVIEAEALQPYGGNQLRFRWVHLLGIADGRIAHDTVYCTGGAPTAGT